jgi:hypothetical protein
MILVLGKGKIISSDAAIISEPSLPAKLLRKLQSSIDAPLCTI